jgi:NTE family protein
VLRELEAAGIPVDVIAGSSIGAVVGVGYAQGTSPEELEAVARGFSSFRRLLGTVDVATTGDGLLAGRQLMQYLRPLMQGADRFEELTLPTRVVATDIRHGRRVALGRGFVDRAVRASIAMPPFVAPVLWDDQTLVDGGIIDPIPCDVARELGADIVIAVNAIPRVHADSTTMLTRMSRGLNRLNPLAYLGGRLGSLNLLDVVMNSFQVVEHELGNHLGRTADVVIEPDVSAHTWIEFYRAPEIIARGAEAGRAAASSVEAVFAERLAAFLPDIGPAASLDIAAEVDEPSGHRWSPVA